MYHLFFSSAVALYGIGFDRFLLKPEPPALFMIRALKGIVSVICTVFFTFIVTAVFLAPRQMAEITPVIAIVFFIPFSVLLEAAVYIAVKKSLREFIAPFLCVLLAIWESDSLLRAVFAGLFSALSYYGFIVIMLFIKKRLEFVPPRKFFSEDALLLVSVAAVIIILFSFGASWLGGKI
jgi:hypothetical protein